MKIQFSATLLSLVACAQACGKSEAKKAIASIAGEYQSEFGSQLTSEAVSAASAGDSEGAGGFNLALAGSSSPFKSVTRKCAVQADGSALVTITSEIDVDKSSSSANISRSMKVTGTSTETRFWTHPSGVQCANAERARLDLKSDAASYGLKVNVERSRQQTMSQTNLRKNTTVSSSRSFTMKGERLISVVSYTEDSAAGTSLQEKKISGSLNRNFSFADKNGQIRSGSFSSATVGDPMVVKVKRSISSKEVVSRELVSGTRKSTLADGTSMDISFANFLMNGAGESCEAQSGNFSIKYYDSEGVVGKTVNCSADAGLLSCTDQSGAEVELESPSCDPADDK
jgi:hypothetical protein